MFPNPQAALPLISNPSIGYYEELSKNLVTAAKGFKAHDNDAIRSVVEKWVKRLARGKTFRKEIKRFPRVIDRNVSQVEDFAIRKLVEGSSSPRLNDAKFVVASAHGFASWPKLSKHVSALSQETSAIARFEAAADAIVSGDLKTLKRLLREDPKLVLMRSTREHNSTLLHYVSANGVEGYRQKTPKNAVQVAKSLLDAGAEVDAEANVYGGGATTLGLTATSVHPFRAGVQNPLLRLLLDYGAEIDHSDSAGNEQGAVLGCLANGRREAALYLAECGAKLNFEAAAGIGRVDILENAFTRAGKPKRAIKRREIDSAFLYACAWGQKSVVEFFLQKGISPNVHRGDGQTALHWAAIGGQLEIVKLLLKLKPPLESRNIYGGTVLGQTLWSAAHGGDPDLYSEIIETLIAAGAKVRERHVPVNEKIDELLRSYGSEPEPSWYWFGEKPRTRV